MKKLLLSVLALLVATVGFAQFNDSDVLQVGMMNKSDVEQIGWINDSDVLQFGFYNDAEVFQGGIDNKSLVVQLGAAKEVLSLRRIPSRPAGRYAAQDPADPQAQAGRQPRRDLRALRLGG